MGAWLDEHLPGDARMIVSPAVRAQQTAEALPRESVTVDAIRPGAHAAVLLKSAGWPDGEGTVVLVGHQPSLGAAAALALTGKPVQWRVKKGGVWWLSARIGVASPIVVAVVAPDLV